MITTSEKTTQTKKESCPYYHGSSSKVPWLIHPERIAKAESEPKNSARAEEEESDEDRYSPSQNGIARKRKS